MDAKTIQSKRFIYLYDSTPSIINDIVLLNPTEKGITFPDTTSVVNHVSDFGVETEHDKNYLYADENRKVSFPMVLD